MIVRTNKIPEYLKAGISRKMNYMSPFAFGPDDDPIFLKIAI